MFFGGAASVAPLFNLEGIRMQKKKLTVWNIVIIVFVLALLASCVAVMSDSSPSKPATAKCKSCGRTFQAGDNGGNYMSIARTGMCKNCYENFKWGMNAIGKDY